MPALLDTTRNPWRVDATGGTLIVPFTITTDLVTIDRMEWSAGGAIPGNEVEVQDNPPGVAPGQGRRLWDEVTGPASGPGPGANAAAVVLALTSLGAKSATADEFSTSDIFTKAEALAPGNAMSFKYQRQLTHRPAQGIAINKLDVGTLLIYYT